MDMATLSTLPPDILAAYLRDPRLAMAQEAQKAGTDYSPVQSPWQGAARMANAAVGALGQNQLQEEYGKSGEAYQSAMADAVKKLGAGDYGGAISATADNPQLSGVGLQIALAKLKSETDPLKSLEAAMLSGYMPGRGAPTTTTPPPPPSPPAASVEGVASYPPVVPVEGQNLPPATPSTMNVPMLDMNEKPATGGANIPPPSPGIELPAPTPTTTPQTQGAYKPTLMDYRVSKDMGVPTGKVAAPGGAIISDPNAKLDDTEARAGGWYERMMDSESTLSNPKISQAGTDPVQNVKASVPLIGNAMVSPEFQQLDQAKRNFINSQLRRESGATITPDEFANANKQYFMQYGDGPEVIAQKAQNRKTAIEGMLTSAGKSYQPKQRAAPQEAAPKYKPEDLTQENIEFTAKKYGITPDEVVKRLGGNHAR